jgi:acylphosphatase
MTYKFNITGLVQGVWYRKFVSENAKKHGFKGYVKNLEDKSVEAVANIKDENELQKFIEILKEGSPHSKVENIRYEKIEDMNFSNFEIRY